VSSPATAATRELDRLGIPYRLVFHGPVSSAEEAAEKRGIPIGALAKTLVVRLDEGVYLLALVPGDSGLDYKKLRNHLGMRRLTMPDPDEARAVTGFERGTITPFGAGEHRIVVDQALMDLDEVSVGSGTHGWAIHVHPSALVTMGAESADIAR